MPDKPDAGDSVRTGELARQLFNETRPEEFAAFDEARFEDDVVGFILKRFKRNDDKRLMLKESRQQYGKPRLSLAAFYERFNFPVRLWVRKIPKVAEDCSLHRLFERFERLKIWKVYEELREDAPDWPWHGLVFHYPYLRSHQLCEGQGGALVLHDYKDDDGDVAGLRLSYAPLEGRRLHLESLHRFLEVLSGDGAWSLD